MLFVLSGSSGSGKTTLARIVERRVSNLAVHELAELTETPWNEDGSSRTWRRRQTERWLRRAGELEAEGVDLLLTEAIFGELLAAPSAPAVSGIAACLVECGSLERLRRLHARAPDEELDAHEAWEYCVWGLWLRLHAEDPQVFAGPIRGEPAPDWQWSRWERWRRGDPRWSISILETTGRTIAESAAELESWVDEQRALHAAGALPLSGRWWDSPLTSVRVSG
ncbi:MAG: hypothetical protein ACRDN6_02400 [Gaiellaceae bacterium]